MTRYGVGIIGTNWGVNVQLPAFRAAGFDVVALAGRQAAKTRRIAQQCGIPYATTDWNTLVNHKDVTLVSVVTPPNLHFVMTEAALEAGKHVLCEKPMALDIHEAWQMLGAAQLRPTQLALIDHELRFLPALQTARQMVHDGRIGQFRRAEVRAITSVRADLRQPWNWWSDVAQGGGVLGTISTHQIDLLRYILADDVASAQGFLSTFITERPVRAAGQGELSPIRPVTADDFATFHLRFVRGGVAVIIASMVARMEEPQSVTLYGDEGVLRFVDGRLLYAGLDQELHDITLPHTIAFPDEYQWLSQSSYACYAEATVYFAHALRQALDGDRAAVDPAATFYDGVHTQQVIDAVRYSSAWSGDWVELSGAVKV
jgi:predicted dehydrogenase